MLRTIGKSFGILLLIFFLSLAVFVHFMVKFTEFDTLNTLFTNIFIGSVISDDKITQVHDSMLKECENKPQSYNVTFDIGNRSVILGCNDIKNSTPEGLANVVGTSIFHDVYYKKYDCSMIECLKSPGNDKYMVLLSQHANNFFKNVQTTVWIFTGIGAVLILISVKGLGNKLKTLGTTLLFLGLTTLILTYITDRFMDFPAEAKQVIGEVFGFLLSASLAITITGAIVMILGYLLNFAQRKRAGKK